MNKEYNTFHAALLTSLLLNSFLWGVTSFNIFLPKENSANEIKISYVQQTPEKPKTKITLQQQKQEITDPPTPKAHYKIAQKIATLESQKLKVAPQDLAKKQLAEIKTFKVSQIKPSLLGLIGVHEFIDLDNLAKLKTKPLFLDYYREVRERIRKYAILNYPANWLEGEVYLTFTLDETGTLRDLGIVDFKSTNEFSLREAALQSVKEAAPFPVFPEGLMRKKITFHIIIAFELGSR
ncbi:MAG: TonB family protein [Candidatus Omnitrophica bacterium]|nr:TonB family protein [Candidatus Omnitrophota bacterium]